jgi:DNA-binding GntR family transcriptional regulator
LLKGKKKLTTPQIYHQLRQMIMDFDLFPGTRVTETELADTFKVSRTPIREALQRLEVEGLVQIRAKQGCFIRPVDTETISNYYDVRVAIETMAVELACKNMPREHLETLCEFWNPDNCSFEFDYPDQIQLVEEAFHAEIAEGSGNPVLAQFLNDVNDHIRVIRRLGFPDKTSIQETYEEHYEICSLMLANKVKPAKKAIEKHIRKSQGIARSVTLSQLEQHKKQSKTRVKRKVLKPA